MTVHDTRLVSRGIGINARGIEIGGVDASFDNATVVTDNFALDVDRTLPATASSVRFINGALDAGGNDYLRGDGNAAIEIYGSTLEGSAFNADSATFTCSGNVISGTFTSSGC